MSQPFDKVITLTEFLTLLGCGEATPPAAWMDGFEAISREYRSLTVGERDDHILEVIKRIYTKRRIRRNTQENIKAFETGWRENLQMCMDEGVSRETLTPKYVKPYKYIRYHGDFIAPKDPYIFEKLLLFAATHFFKRYFGEASSLYEFGCGTGRFLYEIADAFPNKRLVGSDWTSSSQEILKLINKSKPNVSGLKFDMLNPDSDIRLPEKSAVYTIGAMEQLGARWRPFLNYLIRENPLVVVHFEPIEEFYNGDILFDHLAQTYHKKRRYLSKYYSKLKALHKRGDISILESRRLHFGDPFNESCSFIAWKPNEEKTK